jgi:hypothetical protein
MTLVPGVVENHETLIRRPHLSYSQPQSGQVFPPHAACRLFLGKRTGLLQTAPHSGHAGVASFSGSPHIGQSFGGTRQSRTSHGPVGVVCHPQPAHDKGRAHKSGWLTGRSSAGRISQTSKPNGNPTIDPTMPPTKAPSKASSQPPCANPDLAHARRPVAPKHTIQAIGLVNRERTYSARKYTPLSPLASHSTREHLPPELTTESQRTQRKTQKRE